MVTRAAKKALAAALFALCCFAPAKAATQNATVTANIAKPLTLTSLQSLDLGTVTLKPGSWSGATVAISVEPPGGSPTGSPTGPVIASGALTRA